MSSKIYCIANFKPKPGREDALFKALQALEPNAHREDGCLQYTVTRHIDHPNAQGASYPIVFHEIWANREAFEAHCNRREIKEFFATHVESPEGDVQHANVCVYTDEPHDYDVPRSDATGARGVR
ncbi:antibiotic biosynthesis monooxygenase [Billgrantia diversa]|uniref:putative quinol monooxygenase n=1 Tax=Halomonas sp. MCCC 1A13316 TaxID=2733487 RepID=UPI0018A495F0|nr:putative quinol monooxygenase [Halomonas sp. MCCC 1A13316]QOR39782.1 antibiotic biosynthesis monooxygenase [Halomonas sp. MCCC 1A13316]